VSNTKGERWLWVVECFNPSDEPADPLELSITTRWGCQIDDPSLGTVLTDGDGQGRPRSPDDLAADAASTIALQMLQERGRGGELRGGARRPIRCEGVYLPAEKASRSAWSARFHAHHADQKSWKALR
jgi:hypothetical protein